MYCKFSLSHSPIMAHPILLLPPRVSEHLAVPADGMPACIPFITDGKVFEIVAVLVEHHRQTTMRWNIKCRWARNYAAFSIQLQFDTIKKFLACLRADSFLLIWSRFLSLSHWCASALWIIIKYFFNLICKNYIKFMQKNFYSYWSIHYNWKNISTLIGENNNFYSKYFPPIFQQYSMIKCIIKLKILYILIGA